MRILVFDLLINSVGHLLLSGNAHMSSFCLVHLNKKIQLRLRFSQTFFISPKLSNFTIHYTAFEFRKYSKVIKHSTNNRHAKRNPMHSLFYFPRSFFNIYIQHESYTLRIKLRSSRPRVPKCSVNTGNCLLDGIV